MSADNQISIKLDDDMYNAIVKLSAKRNNMSATIRKLITIGLEKEMAKESIDYIRTQINEEIKATCFPQFERLAKLIAKIGYQSISDFYLSSYIMDSILPPSKKVEFSEIQRKSKAMAIAYLKLGPNEFAAFSQSEEKAVDVLNLKGGKHNE